MKYVNNDYADGDPVRSVNACPQPGVAEVELPDDHEAIQDFERRASGLLTAEERADRDMDSRIAQTIFKELNATESQKQTVRQALVENHSPRTRGRKL